MPIALPCTQRHSWDACLPGGLAPHSPAGLTGLLRVAVQQRDPGRTFVLGERLSYVLLPGARTQDDAAEDPLTAAKAGCSGDYELYWQNKLKKPLTEVLVTCLSASQLQVRLSHQFSVAQWPVVSSQEYQEASHGEVLA